MRYRLLFWALGPFVGFALPNCEVKAKVTIKSKHTPLIIKVITQCYTRADRMNWQANQPGWLHAGSATEQLTLAACLRHSPLNYTVNEGNMSGVKAFLKKGKKKFVPTLSSAIASARYVDADLLLLLLLFHLLYCNIRHRWTTPPPKVSCWTSPQRSCFVLGGFIGL